MKTMYDKINSIKTIKDLQKNGLSLSDYNAIKEVYNELYKNGLSKTFIKEVAMFYQKNGFNVSMDDYKVNYIIT